MKAHYFYIIFLLVLISFRSKSQVYTSLDTSRFHTVLAIESTLLLGSLTGLGILWYSDVEHSSFQTFNDNNSWLQMDKAGHTFAAYNIGYYSNEAFEWTGMDKHRRIVYSGAIALTYLSGIEIMDGYSKEWGFSWGDMAANFIGTALFIGQELIFDEQPLRMKYSYHDNKLPDYRKNVLGENIIQQIVKDYNGQTYWASINLKTLIKSENIPTWLNLAIGYSATGMVAAENQELVINSSKYHFNRYRQYYLSFDIALERIKTKSQFANTILKTFSVIKIPFPAFEYSIEKGLKFRALFF